MTPLKVRFFRYFCPDDVENIQGFDLDAVCEFTEDWDGPYLTVTAHLACGSSHTFDGEDAVVFLDILGFEATPRGKK